jgi:hypothetical protein
MNKPILLIFVFILLAINAGAWNSKTHESLVENIYFSMPENLQAKLNLSAMKYGSTAPDLVFHDTVRHHYPPSQEIAYKYLQNISDLETFSYNFGVAAHYITDSFVAPHSVSGEDGALHSKFEKQVNGYAMQSRCGNYNFTLNDLYIAAENKKEWYIWLEKQDSAIPQKELEQAQQFLFSIAIQMLNYSCNEELIYEEKSIITMPDNDIGYLAVIGFLILLILFKLFKHKLA